MARCDRCDRWFKTEKALEQHKDDSNMHHICYKCNKDFTSARSLIQHFTQSPRHPYCQYCDEHFDDMDDLYDHYDDDHYYCKLCNLILFSNNSLHEHRCQEHDDVYCAPCKRMFNNENNLQHHQRSTLHQGRKIDCPMKGCKKAFVSRAALVHHLESGGCTSGMTRTMVNRIVAKLDSKGLFTNQKLLEYGIVEVTKMWATRRAWNGTDYECYLCHRTFQTLERLNQHLNSPAHAEKMYHCPTGAWGGCGTEFRTLSGFCQHVESEQCGVSRFKKKWDKFIDGLKKGSKGLGG